MVRHSHYGISYQEPGRIWQQEPARLPSRLCAVAEINREQLVTALTGKAVERGLRYEIDQETGVIRVRYPEVQGTGRDSLHKQALRGVVRRIAPSWKIEVTSLGVEVGF